MQYIGQWAIYLAVSASIGCALLYLVVWRGRSTLLGRARQAHVVLFAAIVIAAAALLQLILTHQFQVAYVANYSSSDLPLYYLISTFWAGQEGTFLLWILYLSIIGLFLIQRSREYEPGNLFFLNLFILSILLILVKKSPFELLPQTPAEGNGLNPLLQDYWMVIHPPTMFLGFSMAAVPFLFALTGLVDRRYGEWTLAARRWTIVAWLALGIAIVEGGYWAYKVLGWGGFWAWDPVENSSLIPWLFLSAQLHTLSVQRRRQSLTRLAIFMVCLSFWSILYGTFLTRSGVLADFSVHSFVNLGINNFLLAGIAFFILLAVGLVLWRWRDIGSRFPFDTIFSRDYLVTLGIIILVVGAAIVLLGTSAPLLTRLTEKPSAVSQPYYSITMIPVGIVINLLLALFPFFKWGRGVNSLILLAIGATVSAAATAIIYAGNSLTLGIALLLFSAFWGLISNGILLVQGLGKGVLRGHVIVHLGILLLILGATASSVFEKKEQVIMERGRPSVALGYELLYSERSPQGHSEHFRVTVAKDGDSYGAVMVQEQDPISGNVMRKPHIQKYLSRDVYLAPVNISEPEPNQAGLITLGKGEDTVLERYTIKFIDFEVDHGASGPNSLIAVIETKQNYRTETIRPTLEITADGLTPHPVSFDSDRGSLFIAGVRPEQGQVMLQVVGDFLPAPESQTPDVLVAELSIKPWINLFWWGAIIAFLGGLITVIGGPGGRIALKKTQAVSPEITQMELPSPAATAVE